MCVFLFVVDDQDEQHQNTTNAMDAIASSINAWGTLGESISVAVHSARAP
jgi:hypothetical protein